MCSGNERSMASRMPAVITLALDAGGTVVKGVLLVNGQVIQGSFLSRPSQSQDAAPSIISRFASVCLELLGSYISTYGPVFRDDTIQIGFAFPGPFDYEEGVALLQGVDKYEALYDLSVRNLLQAEFMRLKQTSPDQIPDALVSADIRFGNDAHMFGLGVSLRFPCERLICLTLGTGLGSSFIENGQIVQDKNGVPPTGVLFAEPYGDGIIDDYFGRRGILKMASERGIISNISDVADLALAAHNGDEAALDLFHEYGRRLGDMLLPYIAAFHPHRIVLGGQISSSFSLWENEVQNALGETFSIPILPLQDGMSAVFQGIHQLFEKSI